jgi:hypothetical protein
VNSVRILARVSSDDRIAGFLNRANLRTGHGNFWTRVLVASLRHKNGIACHDPKRQQAEGWLTLSQAAQSIGVTNRTLRLGIERGEVAAERPIACGPWILSKQTLQSEMARRFIERVRLGKAQPAVPPLGQVSLDLSST